MKKKEIYKALAEGARFSDILKKEKSDVTILFLTRGATAAAADAMFKEIKIKWEKVLPDLMDNKIITIEEGETFVDFVVSLGEVVENKLRYNPQEISQFNKYLKELNI